MTFYFVETKTPKEKNTKLKIEDLFLKLPNKNSIYSEQDLSVINSCMNTLKGKPIRNSKDAKDYISLYKNICEHLRVALEKTGEPSLALKIIYTASGFDSTLKYLDGRYKDLLKSEVELKIETERASAPPKFNITKPNTVKDKYTELTREDLRTKLPRTGNKYSDNDINVMKKMLEELNEMKISSSEDAKQYIKLAKNIMEHAKMGNSKTGTSSFWRGIALDKVIDSANETVKKLEAKLQQLINKDARVAETAKARQAKPPEIPSGGVETSPPPTVAACTPKTEPAGPTSKAYTENWRKLVEARKKLAERESENSKSPKKP